jgi:hypothetical protein
MRLGTLALASALVAAAFALLPSGDVLAGKDEPKPTVKFAKTWDAAVAEAKTLNLPIVVHSHGFY